MNLYNIIKNKKEYWLVDQVKCKDIPAIQYKQQFIEVLDEWYRDGGGFLSVLMDESHENWLFDMGLQKVSSIVEYTRNLDDLSELDPHIKGHSLSDGGMNDHDYGQLYELCRKGSANRNKQQPIEQVMNSLKSELGPTWRNHCYYFTKDDALIGIAIPHIEMETKDEGRLFYFGVVPHIRGKGIGTIIHRHALVLLKQFKATYYVGSTDIHNQNMIQIFQRNGCQLRDRKGIYRIES
ncbi:acetyltransferase (GNAT) family protein [Bacillus oleivorans]|uniref:Acetyltransferase (GNAT) family protein n=1 Tax=Bacillus oleivorans TaxID=1448271 RepID=A0A285CGX0_9BACI|nr:GNAT family N-acetyltransferase [Bacillus oleivorans]SNX66760.1 acetyltransferase (GNAT) family protein [Bacillus oleivorans]